MVENASHYICPASQEAHRELHTVAGVMLVMLMVTGVTGNVLTVLAFMKSRKLRRNVTNIFIIWLSIADIMFDGFINPIQALSYFKGGWIPEQPLCMWIGFFAFSIGIVSPVFLVVLSINRYILIVHYSVYKTIYSTSNVIFIVGCTWGFTFVTQIPILLGIWGKYEYDPETQFCYIREDGNGRNSRPVIFVVAFSFTCFVIIFCYTRIFWEVRSSRKRLKKHNKGCKVEALQRKEKHYEWQITKVGLAKFITFVFCYLPLSTLRVINPHSMYVTEVAAVILSFMSGSINPIIYIIINSQYRKAYIQLFKGSSRNKYNLESSQRITD